MDKMKMNAKQISACLHAVAMTLLSITLIISVGFAWYTSNKRVEVDTIYAVAASDDIGILRKSLFRESPYDSEGNFINPYPLGGTNTDKDNITGLLSGEIIYLSISVESFDSDEKGISASLLNINGGEFFTRPEEYITDVTLTPGMSEDEVFSSMVGTTDTGKLYKLSITTNNEDGTTTTNETDKKLYQDSNGEFYLSSDESDRWYRNYIYTDAQGKKYNMCDVYFIKLCAVTLSDRRFTDMAFDVYNDDFKGFDNGGNKIIAQMNIGTYDVWNSSDKEIITFTFALKFDFTALSGLINTNCVSSKKLIFEQLVMRSEG